MIDVYLDFFRQNLNYVMDVLDNKDTQDYYLKLLDNNKYTIYCIDCNDFVCNNSPQSLIQDHIKQFHTETKKSNVIVLYKTKL